MLNDQISQNRDVILVDLRNHGESDWHPSMTYTEMAEDLVRFLDSRELDQVTLIGHNIGGKTAMRFAGLYPWRLKGLICLDTAPVQIAEDKAQSTRDIIR